MTPKICVALSGSPPESCFLQLSAPLCQKPGADFTHPILGSPVPGWMQPGGDELGEPTCPPHPAPSQPPPIPEPTLQLGMCQKHLRAGLKHGVFLEEPGSEGFAFFLPAEYGLFRAEAAGQPARPLSPRNAIPRGRVGAGTLGSLAPGHEVVVASGWHRGSPVEAGPLPRRDAAAGWGGRSVLGSLRSQRIFPLCFSARPCAEDAGAAPRGVLGGLCWE